jgi:hypothetical protein
MKFTAHSGVASSLASLGAAALVALFALSALPPAVQAAPIRTCSEQSKCLKFQVFQLAGTLCTGLGSCPVRVCMRFDTNDPDCIKDGATVSHACDNADAKGCVRTTKPWILGTNADKGKSVDLDESGTCTTNTSDTRCGTIRDEFLMCQDGKPDDILYFTVYVVPRLGSVCRFAVCCFCYRAGVRNSISCAGLPNLLSLFFFWLLLCWLALGAVSSNNFLLT